MHPAEVQTYDQLIEQGRFIINFTYLEVLLAQRPILLNLNNEGKKILLELSISNYEEKNKLPEYFATFGLKTPSLVLGRLLDVNNNEAYIRHIESDKQLEKFIDSSILYEKSSLTTIINLAKKIRK